MCYLEYSGTQGRDVPPARVNSFGLLVWPRVCLLAIFVGAEICFLAFLVKERSRVGDSRMESNNLTTLL